MMLRWISEVPPAIVPPNEPAVVEHQPLPAACPVRDVATGPGPFKRVGLRRQVFIQKRDEVRTEGLDVSVERQLHGAPGGRKFERLLLSPK